jgi:hypothetical protein
VTEISGTGARRRIREIFDSVVADGMRPDAVAGASAAELSAWANSQGVSTLPDAVAEVFALVGVKPGPWWYGSTIAIPHLDGEMKALALECLEYSEGELIDPEDMLVLLAHGGYEFHVIDGSDLNQEDPPVWRIVEGDPIERHWDSVTAWFTSAAVSVRAMQERVRRAVAEDSRNWPEWQRFFRLSQ